MRAVFAVGEGVRVAPNRFFVISKNVRNPLMCNFYLKIFSIQATDRYIRELILFGNFSNNIITEEQFFSHINAKMVYFLLCFNLVNLYISMHIL